MMGLLVGLYPYVLMAVKAEVRLPLLQAFLHASVHRMTHVARNSCRLVPADGPEGKMRCLFVAGKTYAGLHGSIGLAAESGNGHTPSASFFRVT
jgi:hypothetical protein